MLLNAFKFVAEHSDKDRWPYRRRGDQGHREGARAGRLLLDPCV